MKLKIIPNQHTPSVKNCKNSIFLSDDMKLFEKFLWFAHKRKNCIGLAANQVSLDGQRIMKPFFVIKHIENPLPYWEMIIHPEITGYIGQRQIKHEGCLTWIGKTIIAERYPEIVVKYLSLKNEVVIKVVSGVQAQIWQHEYDHLMGVEEKVVKMVKK